MEAYHTWLNSLVNANRDKFREYHELKWLNSFNAKEFQKIRDKYTQSLSESSIFKNTKPYHYQLSRGCKLCGMGVWSCLFITGKCNAKCFYCPTAQTTDDLPTTQGLSFPTAEAYAEYINYFKFKGVSFSGGEPLLFFDRTLNFLKQIRKKCDPDIYIWMYTNGILGDEQKFKKLAKAGLNEVRFDIGATGFSLDKVKTATGIIPIVTIEIPAVHEETEKLKLLLPEMVKLGVNNINLHQLRLTKYNAHQLIKRKYTFIHAEQPIVLESELAALELITYAKKHHINIGINYCSFHFKNRFQKVGYRKMVNNRLARPEEIISSKGYIEEFNTDSIAFKNISLKDTPPNSNDYAELKLKHKTYFLLKETVLKKTALDTDEKSRVNSLLLKEPDEIPSDPLLFDIWQCKYIEKGLREY
ncbi:radical SAM protein [Prolixibacteraceae bacterium Z1-6]|uniref:Radical SAM protein n=1 Tax=Draconibacterium aestuarii TaxID=2998507 RepID=A0A9X3FGQ8_9BACT|nr:radical SAM protein [Prolixibacteraceae bacterium Z1-6]